MANFRRTYTNHNHQSYEQLKEANSTLKRQLQNSRKNRTNLFHKLISARADLKKEQDESIQNKQEINRLRNAVVLAVNKSQLEMVNKKLAEAVNKYEKLQREKEHELNEKCTRIAQLEEKLNEKEKCKVEKFSIEEVTFKYEQSSLESSQKLKELKELVIECGNITSSKDTKVLGLRLQANHIQKEQGSVDVDTEKQKNKLIKTQHDYIQTLEGVSSIYSDALEENYILQKERTKNNETITLQNSQIHKAGKIIDELQEIIVNNEKKIQEGKKCHEKEKVKMQEEMQQVKVKLVEKDKQIGDFVQEREKFQAKLKEKNHQIESFAREREQFQAKLKEKNYQIENFVKVREQFQAKLKEKNHQIENFAREREQFQAKLKEKNHQNENFVREREQFQAKLMKKDKQIENIVRERDQFQARLLKKDKQIENTVQKREQFQVKLAEKDEKIKKIVQERKHFQVASAEKDEKIANLVQERKQFQAKLKEKDERMQNYVKELQQVQANLVEKDEHAKNFLEEMQQVRAKLAEKDTHMRSFVDEREKVLGFLETVKEMAQFPGDDNFPLINQLDEFKNCLKRKLKVVATFCDLVDSVQKVKSVPPPSSSPSKSTPILKVKRPIKKKKKHSEDLSKRVPGRRPNDIGGKYFCLCGKFIGISEDFLQKHIQHATQQRKFKCDKCSRRFLFLSQLDKHLTSAHGRQIEGAGKCLICGILFKTREEKASHVHHGNTESIRKNINAEQQNACEHPLMDIEADELSLSSRVHAPPMSTMRNKSTDENKQGSRNKKRDASSSGLETSPVQNSSSSPPAKRRHVLPMITVDEDDDVDVETIDVIETPRRVTQRHGVHSSQESTCLCGVKYLNHPELLEIHIGECASILKLLGVQNA